MKQSAYRNTPLRQIVVQSGCLARFQYVVLHAIQVQPLDRLRGRPQDKLHAAGQYDEVGAMFDQLGDIDELNARIVPRIGFPPIPRAPTAGPKLHILARPETMNSHESPR